MSKEIIRVGNIAYEPEVLTALTEQSTILQTQVDLWEYVSKKWDYSEEKGEYQANSRKDKRDRTIFNSLYFHVRAIWASDKNGVIESPEELFELARSDNQAFLKLYASAIKANPGLTVPSSSETVPESEPDPNS